MGQIRLRPGPWKVVHDGTGLLNPEIQIDYEKFDVANGSTVEFEVLHMGLIGSADNMVAFRNPVKTVVSTSSTGGELAEPTASPNSK